MATDGLAGLDPRCNPQSLIKTVEQIVDHRMRSMMRYCIEIIACLIVNEYENDSKAKMFDDAKDREPSRTKTKYSI